MVTELVLTVAAIKAVTALLTELRRWKPKPRKRPPDKRIEHKSGP